MPSLQGFIFLLKMIKGDFSKVDGSSSIPLQMPPKHMDIRGTTRMTR